MYIRYIHLVHMFPILSCTSRHIMRFPNHCCNFDIAHYLTPPQLRQPAPCIGQVGTPPGVRWHGLANVRTAVVAHTTPLTASAFVGPISPRTYYCQMSPGDWAWSMDHASTMVQASLLTRATSCMTSGFGLSVTCQILTMVHVPTYPDKTVSTHPDQDGRFNKTHKICRPIGFSSIQRMPKCHTFIMLPYTVCDQCNQRINDILIFKFYY